MASNYSDCADARLQTSRHVVAIRARIHSFGPPSPARFLFLISCQFSARCAYTCVYGARNAAVAPPPKPPKPRRQHLYSPLNTGLVSTRQRKIETEKKKKTLTTKKKKRVRNAIKLTSGNNAGRTCVEPFLTRALAGCQRWTAREF